MTAIRISPCTELTPISISLSINDSQVRAFMMASPSYSCLMILSQKNRQDASTMEKPEAFDPRRILLTCCRAAIDCANPERRRAYGQARFDCLLASSSFVHRG